MIPFPMPHAMFCEPAYHIPLPHRAAFVVVRAAVVVEVEILLAYPVSVGYAFVFTLLKL